MINIFYSQTINVTFSESIITEHNDLSTPWVLGAALCRDVLLTEIDSGVSEFCWANAEVTCDVCSVVHFGHVKFLCIADMTVAIIDDVLVARGGVVTSTPFNKRIINVTFTSQCHRRALYHCCVQWTANQYGFYNCCDIITCIALIAQPHFTAHRGALTKKNRNLSRFEITLYLSFTVLGVACI